MGESTWAEISAQAKNHQSAWEKVNGLKIQLVSRIISQPNGGTRKITQGKFYLSTYKDPTGRTLPCYTLTKTECLSSRSRRSRRISFWFLENLCESVKSVRDLKTKN